MYLKTIDIVGYKSFANKTRIDLEPGITGIIGPNGCGKSNIMDAVRWCLGEMSWKSLRADRMVEVIFAGTDKRAPLSMTEVVLTFDNAQGLLPVQYSEVTVSRKIFRSGESEYYLNKTQCRLRDIRELFMDTGVGVDGYAVIDQGGVDFVISAKPEERRALFEEAAGVAKYKVKREEALRKLDRVEMDMGRLKDSVSLITEQVKKLDTDARRAKLYQKSKVELKALEAAQVLQQVSDVRKELEQVAENSRPVEEKLGSRKVELSAEGANLAALNLEKAEQTSLRISTTEKVAGVKSEISRFEERRENSAKTITGIDARKLSCDGEIIQANERRTGIDPEIDRAQEALKKAQSQYDQAKREYDSFAEGVTKLREEAASVEASLNDLKKEGLEAADKELAAKREFAAKQSQLTHQEADLKQVLKGLEKETVAVAEKLKEIAGFQGTQEEQAGRLKAAQDESAAREAAFAEVRRKQAALSAQVLQLHADLAAARAWVVSLEEAGAQNPYWVGANAVTNAGLGGILGTVRSIIQVEESKRGLLEDALGERLYAVVCEDSEAARAGVEFLKAAGKGRARFLVLSTLPAASMERAYPEGAKAVIADISFDAKYDNAVRFLLQETYTLGKTLFSDHWVCGGAADTGAAPSIADIGEWRGKAASLEARQVELGGQKTVLETEFSGAETARREALSALHQEAAKTSALEAEIRTKEEELNLNGKEVEISTSEAVHLLGELALGLEIAAGLKKDSEQAAAKERDCAKKEDEARQRLSINKEELSRAEGAFGGLDARVKDQELGLPNFKTAVVRLVSEKENLDKVVAGRETEISQLVLQREREEASAADAAEKLARLGESLALLENESKSVIDRLHALENQAADKEERLRKLREEADAAQAELHALELRSGSLKTRAEDLKSRLWDEWQLAEEEAVAKYANQEVNPERMEMLRNRIINFGNINMAAPEEYEELSKRQVFLNTQIEDLSKAKEDLRNAIQKINASTMENFRQTFVEVREHFRKLYGVLFEGGVADLILTDPDNILETGVDIEAQPPGKRLQSISLLSGGEKALTAIALLFAFFMVKHSPFCMLDEADAALDDANVERFVGLLKEFQAKTQFLIVSHNKKTMESADVIYGVTMEELGVSQLISVDFRKRTSPPGSPSGAESSPAANQV